MAVLRVVLRIGVLAATVVAGTGLLAGCRTGPEQWGPFRGRVVDVETGMPIAGAHVMVSWFREPPSLHYSQSFYDAQETVTDRDGRFEIEHRTRVLTAFVEPPIVDVFAPDYRLETLDSNGDDEPRIEITMRLLRSAEDKCRLRPSRRWEAADQVPVFMQAVHNYNLTACAGRE